ncbi:MAG TPA: dienelactone hydrolase family protein [Acidimicrobiia bacterium]|nr:dienelactone hydrolase family protein [Acidimicrobiia bacterium]
MRTWETVQLGVVVTAVLLPVLLGYRLKRGRMAALLLGVMVVQLVVEGYRWQLLPLELTTIGLAVGDILRDERRVRGVQRFRRGALGPVGAATLAILPMAFPIPEFPVPGGPFPVGTQTFVVIDEERLEEYGLPEREGGEDAPQPSEPRRFVVQVWYPATTVGDLDPLPWNPDFEVVGPALAERLGLPGFMLSHVADVPSHSYPDVPAVSGRLPVVIYSHGWTGFRTIALHQIESLASRGFVVVVPDHTYGAVAEVFPNGTVVPYDPRALPDEEEVGTADFLEAGEQLVETFAGDIVAIIDALEIGTTGPFSRLAPEVDLDRIGVFGHSTGGGAAVRACIEDGRCSAVVGLDAWVRPIPDRIVARELSVPSMFIRSDEWRSSPNDGRLRGLAERSPSDSYWIHIEGAGHNDFLLTPLLSPVADRMGLKGPISVDRIVPIVDTYLTAFFQRHLMGMAGTALDEPPPSEATVEYLP